RITVPIPGPTEIARLFDDTDIRDTRLLKVRCRQETPKTATNDQHVGLLMQRGPCKTGLDVGVGVEVREFTGDLLVLAVSVCAQALFPLIAILLTQRIDIDAQLCRGWNSTRFGFRYSFTHALLLEFFVGYRLRSVPDYFSWRREIPAFIF